MEANNHCVVEVIPPDRIGFLVAEMDADQVQQVPEQAGHLVFQKAGVLRCNNVLLLNKENKLNLPRDK